MRSPENHDDHDGLRLAEPEERKPKRAFIGGFDHALDGIRLVVGTQRNMKFHVLVALAVVAAGIFLGISALEFAVLALTIATVFAAEIINTAIEAVVDIASPERHPLAKTAKDCAAGAVLVLSIGAVIVGVLVFYDEVVAIMRGLLSS